MITQTEIGRYVLWHMPTWKDHLRFPTEPVASGTAEPLPRATTVHPATLSVSLPRGGEMQVDKLLHGTGTLGFLVIRDGKVVCEWFRDGITESTIVHTMSVSKSVTWCLVGQAVARGELESLEAPIGDYLDGIADPRTRRLSIAALLRMASGLRFREGVMPWSDDARTYHGTNLRARALRIPVRDPVDAWFHYNNWCTLLIAMLLERVSGRRVADLLGALWHDIGGGAATLCTDTDGPAALGHLESGLNCSTADLARIGQLVLQRGRLNGRTVLPSGWTERLDDLSDAWMKPEHFAYYRKLPWGRPLSSGRYAYKDFWWHYVPRPDIHDVFAMGVLGAHVYVSRDTDCVIVRQAGRFPPGMWWAPVLRSMAEQVAAH